MKTMDFLCGQNWVGQFVSGLQRASFEWSHDKELVEVTDDYGADVINQSFDWDGTAQCFGVWQRRNDEFMCSSGLIR